MWASVNISDTVTRMLSNKSRTGKIHKDLIFQSEGRTASKEEDTKSSISKNKTKQI